ncbi:cysteine-rich motor neuron 1 protein-like isoform X3 [Amphibalanus amphitrite]|uniref:cysteine-rich motor neuron 1 protein-like isoform X3 n=1 Tax=Amphibalanus amphitrite TaxID=1232801 RepID=UPI001C91C10B|nr:cysteine-rich motor neuron 1 protein-like isoform X3 [Amphibalanus amphitrite]
MLGVRVLLRLLPPLLLLLLAGLTPPAAGSLCFCDRKACPTVTCSEGRSPVPDDCNCCLVCGQAEGERCGGNHELYGRCSEGLECRRRPPGLGQPIGQATEGVCTAVGCQICQLILGFCTCTQEEDCPDVSRNPTAFYSRTECEKAAARPPPAAAVTAAPTAADACADVSCLSTAEGTSLSGCPVDSVLKLAPPARPDCCPSVAECVCDLESCPRRPQCAHGQPTVVRAGDRRPGSCCSIWDCKDSEEENSTCVHQGKRYEEGATWQMDQCTTCHCKDAVSFCDQLQCPELGPCPQVTDPGQCCPRCIDGCLSRSGVFHNNSEQWEEDECTTCSCADNELHCHIAQCNPPCRNPVHVPGRCCPVCNQTECAVVCEHGYRTDSKGRPLCQCVTAAEPEPKPQPRPEPTPKPQPRCRDMSSCKKQCPHGFKVNSKGCARCKCHHCRRLKGCPLTCPLDVNDRGCTVCRCREGATGLPAPVTTPTPTPTPTVHRLSCVSTAGEVHAPGASWDDGCRQCYCHEGTEMCSMIACAVPACEHPEIEPGQCCPTCPDDSVVPSRHVNLTVCLSATGGTYLEGQTWHLDSCTSCLCRGGRVLCSHPVCPPAACPQPERRPGHCCPVCPGRSPTGGSTEPPPEGRRGGRACAAGPGPSWPDGAAWRSSACVSCRCRNGATRCYHERCPKLSCERPVLSKGRCCPHCIAEATRDGSCFLGNRTLASGESWQVDACKSCVCRAGQLSCAQKVCSTACRGPVPAGHCCPVCKEDVSTTSRHNYPFLNGTSKVAHRIRVPDPATETPEPDPEETDGAELTLVQKLLISGLSLLTLVLLIAVCGLCFCKVRKSNRFTPKKQPLQVLAEEEKKPLNGAQTLDCSAPLSTISSPLRPPETVIGMR